MPPDSIARVTVKSNCIDVQCLLNFRISILQSHKCLLGVYLFTEGSLKA